MKPYCTNAQWQGRAECHLCPIREKVIFADVEDAALAEPLSAIDNFSVPARNTLYQEGQAATAVFTLRQGRIKLVRALPSGQQRLVRILKPGDSLGLEALLHHQYRHTAITLDTVDLCQIPTELIDHLRHSFPTLVEALFQRWQQQLDQADLVISEFSSGPAQGRLARLLLHLHDFNQANEQCRLSRDELAEMVGVTTETTSRIVAAFKRQGLIKEVQGCLEVVQPDMLAAVARDDPTG